jgi:hypothetical protein
MSNTGRADNKKKDLQLRKSEKQYVQKNTQIKEHRGPVAVQDDHGRRRWMLVRMIRAKRHPDKRTRGPVDIVTVQDDPKQKRGWVDAGKDDPQQQVTVRVQAIGV